MSVIVDALHVGLISLAVFQSTGSAPDRSLSACIASSLAEIKEVVTVGWQSGTEESKAMAIAISEQMQSVNIFKTLVSMLRSLTADARKDVCVIFTALMRGNIGMFLEYLEGQIEHVIKTLVDSYQYTEISLICGTLIRECMHYEALAQRIVSHPENIWPFFDIYVHLPQFEIASDAFATLKELVTTPGYKDVSREFVSANLDIFLTKFETMLLSENYVTKRKALRLLTEMLLDRTYHRMMMKYISSKEHLKTIMNMLRQKSMQIQYESFHVFKIFVANPHKSPEVANVLFNNRDKIIAFLQTFQEERDDPLFKIEKNNAIEVLMQLPGPDLRSQLLKHHSASGPEATMVVEKEGPGILSSTGGDLITSNPTSRTQSLQNIKTALAAELSGPSAPHRPPSPPCSDSPAVQPLSSPPL